MRVASQPVDNELALRRRDLEIRKQELREKQLRFQMEQAKRASVPDRQGIAAAP